MYATQQKLQRTSNKPKNIKYHNQKLILSMFRKAENLSIPDIADKINLSKTTVTKVVNDFAAKGLVKTSGKGSSTDVGGKKPELFAFNASFLHVITLSLGIKTLSCAVMDLKCHAISSRSVDCDIQVSYKKAIRRMADIIHAMMKEAGLSGREVHSIVLGCEGIIDATSGVIRYTVHHAWGTNLPVREDLARALAFPATIYVNNNSRLAGYYQALLNADLYEPVAVITSSFHSIGGSILENQQPMHGANGFIGEIGHMIIEPYSEIKCHCGGYGCFESLVSPQTVLAQAGKLYTDYPRSCLYRKAKEGALTITDVFEASNQQDPLACILLDKVIRYFSILIHNIVLLRDPSRIVIQGVYSSAGDYFLEQLRRQVNSLPFYKVERDLPIVYAPASALNVYLIGAGYYAVDVFLDTNSLYD
ncbi:MAG: ROK family transcriptional regulator [Spirochaetales bacterium]|nr:ROK family transcriptional regulator [Spirochaetales bacterium]